MNLLLVVLIGAVLAPAAFGREAEPLLISPEALAKEVGSPRLVLLHVGKKEEYGKAHIAGARFINLQDISVPVPPGGPGLTLEMPPVDQLRSTFAGLGISDDSDVVAYGGVDTSFQTVTRVVFTLQYVGLGDRTSILNGGLKAWIDENRDVTAVLPVVTRGRVSVQPKPDLIVDAAFVKEIDKHPGQKLVDARAASFYTGAEAAQGKNGHIPGAVNIPFSAMLNAEAKVDEKQIRSAFAEAGIRKGDTVVAYCHIGQQATAVILGARLLGNPVKLYDGSFQDWAINNRGPVEK
jgi:thiosulfate/3-mercaptopyruvate sulfurtransferase